jgi:ribosomal protein S27AE
MTYTGCQSKSKEITLTERTCPNCGNVIELFSVDTEVACDRCGFVAYNDTLSCVQWCQYARQCVGDEMYEAMMAVARRNKEEKANEKKNHQN